MYCHITLRMEP